MEVNLRKWYRSEYTAYTNAKQRCRPEDKDHKYYYDRGIRFLFVDFHEFLDDIGPQPYRGYQIDRKDNDGNYEPGNMRWVSKSVQMRNRRGWKCSAEARLNMTYAHIGHKHSAETKKRIRIAALKREARKREAYATQS